MPPPVTAGLGMGSEKELSPGVKTLVTEACAASGERGAPPKRWQGERNLGVCVWNVRRWRPKRKIEPAFIPFPVDSRRRGGWIRLTDTTYHDHTFEIYSFLRRRRESRKRGRER
mmetsp:Transcript_15135/g.21217  ORF Transcript_15135/g.21217 Transcript_15135/m.21217 type:complete len:114 (-) Transcript_15135:516-857(-)